MRRELQKRRRGLKAEEAEAMSRVIGERFKAAWAGLLSGYSLPSASDLRVALYRAQSYEVALEGIESAVRASGARVFYPRVDDLATAQMELVEADVNDSGSWEEGAYGILQPAAHHPAVDPSELDLVLVPGVAFGESGERIGMGAGFYDRFLARAPRALRVAVAYDFQVLEKLEQKEWDQPVHWVLTEKRDVKSRAFERAANAALGPRG